MQRLLSSCVALCSSAVVFAQDASRLPQPAAALALESTGRSSRSAVFSDALLARIARGTWSAPSAGEELVSATGETRAWREVALDARGELAEDLPGGGWVFASFEHERDEVALLEPSGFAFVYSNGEPRAGDLYQLGLVRVPIALHAGRNELLGKLSRGRPRLAWSAPPAPVFIEQRDRTLPDLLRDGEPDDGARCALVMGIVVTNATAQPRAGLSMRARVGAAEPCATALDPLAPLETRKCAVWFERLAEPSGASARVQLELLGADGAVLHADSFELAVRSSNELHKRTLCSAIDDSVQYYAVQPPRQPVEHPALVLTLHGAGVEGSGQAAAYAPKDWAYVVAPTNRRPYGFDWEDWGRLDALEVLDRAQYIFGTDERRTYLTGHSMGGHGTWQIGVHDAERFAALAPSAGWTDFWSYMGAAGAPPSDPLEALLYRACNVSRTTLLERNLAGRGVYVLHGDADDNVPVGEARKMRAELAGFHADFAYYERPGAGHWWGNECVDWPPLFEFLRRHESPDPLERLAVEFRTVDLGLLSRVAWVELQQQQQWREVSHVSARCDPERKRIVATTENVAQLAFHLFETKGVDDPGLWSVLVGVSVDDELEVALDGQELGKFAVTGDMHFQRAADGRWKAAEELWSTHKNPARCGPFKAAFQRHFTLVVGTHGSGEESAWAWAKARFDAETFRYRGNASPRLISDDGLLAGQLGRPTAECNFVLYGHREMNAAWRALVASDALDVTRGALRVGARKLEGEDLAVLAVLPGHAEAQSIAVVAGTGLLGLRTTNHWPYFVSGAGFPDWLVARTEALERGAPGIVGAGFFAADWTAEVGAQSAWR